MRRDDKSSKGGNQGKTSYQRQIKGSGSKGQNLFTTNNSDRNNGGRNRNQERLEGDEIDLKFGFERIKEGPTRIGWLLNFLPVSFPDDQGSEQSGIDLYLIDRLGENFKATLFYRPYFYLDILEARRISEVANQLQKRFESCVAEVMEKEDLDMPNHLSGKRHKFLKVSFNTVKDLMDAKSKLWPQIQQNLKREQSKDYEEDEAQLSAANKEALLTSKILGNSAYNDPFDHILEMREYDVPYEVRAAIDLDLRVGAWYDVTPVTGSETCDVVWKKDMLELCDLRVLAFDIECEKAPLKFPDATRDRIYMISYMVSGQGYLLINREIVSEDVDDFEYTPSPKFPGPFVVINLSDEETMLRKFVSHIQELRPHVVVTYNGDFFDWPYVETRCNAVASLNLYRELGIRSNETSGGGATGANGKAMEGEYRGRCMVHLDAFCWVKRDSYLPQGTQGLKAVTRNKLGYDPVEVDPEEMLPMARERPTYMASYSVSDAVATYYLYVVYVHNFIFSMSTIIPMGSEDVLRKGSGTLCEALLMVEAYRGNIICPNKQNDPLESFHNGHLLESETYIGGHVECLEAGVFRADIPAKFKLAPSALQDLINRIDRDLTFALETEHDIQRTDITNYDEIRQAIVEKLEMLRDRPIREEFPVIYHLDVGAMYPNIILTNRLQPSAMVSDKDCAACEFNRADSDCKRPMTWTWRGEYSPADQSEFQSVRRQLTYEKVGDQRFTELSEKNQAALVKQRLKKYSSRVYKKSKVTLEENRANTVCMRENAFYVNTVRAFRDRRYEYKLLTKTWKGKKSDAEKIGDALARKVAEDKETLMDSLQLAHKCILNSFYGYVMRKGARWRSMEMAGIVTYTGAELIKQARELVEQVGRPLELDTDGIWCILPSSFPQDFKFKTRAGKSVSIGYPCAMLNADVHDRYTNHQYQDLASGAPGGAKRYNSHSECSIYFELDGPYKAMVLPASPEEGKLLKKKYVVFNFDGSVAELKGFEMKRRGELELVKIFQSQVFEQFLAGSSLRDCYDSVAAVANQWLDVLDSQGMSLEDSELMELISERKTISKTLGDYEGRKATSLTTAARLADFLGVEMVKDKGLNCNLIISRLPQGAPVTERAIPVAIFSADNAVKKHYLRKWLKDPSFDCTDFRDVVDWSYYKERLGKTIQKIVTIPAGMQGLANPVPRVEHPIWLTRSLAEVSTGMKQAKISTMFARMNNINAKELMGPKLVSSQRDGVSPSRSRDTPTKSRTLLLSPVRNSDRKRALGAAASSPIGLFGDMEDMVGTDSRGTGGRPIAHFKPQRSVSFALEPLTPLANSNSTTVGPSEVALKSLSASNSSALELTSDVTTPVEDTLVVSEVASDGDLQAWLAARKKQWKSRRQERKVENLRRQAISNGFWDKSSVDSLLNKRPLGVADFVKNAAIAATHGIWQIIEMQESDVPGEFIVWAMIGSSKMQMQLQKLRVTVPRTILVNCRGKQAEVAVQELGGVRVKRDLPHGRPCLNLYEVTVPEKKYLRYEKSVTQFMCDPEVEGVYETGTPLWFRAVMSLGCLAQVNNHSSTDARNNVFKLHDLDMISTSNHTYLQNMSNSAPGNNAGVFKTIYLFSAFDKSRSSGLGAIGMFIIENNFDETMYQDQQQNLMSGKAFLWLISGRNGLDSKPPLQRLYRKFQSNEEGSIKFSTKSVTTVAEAYQACGESLSAYIRQRHGPTVVVAQGAYDAKTWRRFVPVLQEFPLATVPANSSDEMFPAVGWQTFVGERMIQRFLIFPRWMNDRLLCARHSNIPFCNLDQDAPTTMTDVLFARQLHHNRHLLWASERLHPDLGGSETDETAVWSEPLIEPIVNAPGAYRTVCVAVEIFGLDICAILSSGLLDTENLISVSIGKGEDTTAASSVSTDASCTRAFNLLKAIVAKWYDDMSRRDDPIAHSLLTTLYRYLCGYGDALLKDPALHRVVYILMSKLFKRLMGQLRKLGTEIVHANFSRVIINTKKHDQLAASEYVEFILSALRSNSMFSYLEMNVKEYWQQMLWLGPENWGGLLFPPETETITDDTDKDELIDVDDEVVAMDADTCDNTTTDSPFKNTHSKNSATAIGNGNTVSDKKTKESDEYAFLDNLLGGSASNKNKAKGKTSTKRDDDDDFEEDDDIDEPEYADEYDREGSDEYADDDVNSPRTSNRNSTDAEKDQDPTDPLLKSSWNMASYLPSAAAIYFKHIVGEYMLQYRKYRNMRLAKKEAFLLSLSQSADTPREGTSSDVLMTNEAIDERVNEDMKNMIQRQLGSGLLRLVDELAMVYSHGYNAKQREQERQLKSPTGVDALPLLLGGTISPALEFVKATTHVLSLDSALEEEVSALKRMLLSQLRVREFNDDSQFKDPCVSYVLSDVICTYCSLCRDYDLLRDPVLSDANLTISERWRCPNCHTAMNLVQVENRLLSEIDKMCTAFLVQDFRCPRTHAVSVRLCAPTSDLCLELAMDKPPSSVRESLRIMHYVSRLHKFTLLEQSVQELSTSGLF